MKLYKLKEKILQGYQLSQQEALELVGEDLELLCKYANEIRQYFCGNKFDVCTIINAKSGRCSENCKYCAQSAHYPTACDEYPLLSSEELKKGAIHNAKQGVMRYSIVTSGRNLNNVEIEAVCEAAKSMREVPIKLCGSFGLLETEQYQKLYQAGITRMHNNLETSERNFPNMCSTHSFQDKVASIQEAQAAGMYICSGGIMGIGEQFEDRIDLAFSLKALHVQSVPLNMLIPVKGTPYEHLPRISEAEFKRTIAIFRFILPTAFIRLAGGRGNMSDAGYSLFESGANATITGDMLTTVGISIEEDIRKIKEMGFDCKLKSASY